MHYSGIVLIFGIVITSTEDTVKKLQMLAFAIRYLQSDSGDPRGAWTYECVMAFMQSQGHSANDGVLVSAEDKLQKYESYLDWKSAAWTCINNVGGPLVNLARVPFNWTVWDKLKTAISPGDLYWIGGYNAHTPLFWIYGCYDFLKYMNSNTSEIHFLIDNSVRTCSEKCGTNITFIGLKGLFCYCIKMDLSSIQSLSTSRCENKCTNDVSSRDICGSSNASVSIYKRLNASEIVTEDPSLPLDSSKLGTCAYIQKVSQDKWIWGTADCNDTYSSLCQTQGVLHQNAKLTPIRTKYSWNAASSNCVNRGMYLAYVKEEDTRKNLVFNNIPTGPKIWVGLYRHDIQMWLENDKTLLEPKTCTVVYRNAGSTTLNTKTTDCNDPLKPICQASMTLTADGPDIGTPAPTTLLTTTEKTTESDQTTSSITVTVTTADKSTIPTIGQDISTDNTVVSTVEPMSLTTTDEIYPTTNEQTTDPIETTSINIKMSTFIGTTKMDEITTLIPTQGMSASTETTKNSATLLTTNALTASASTTEVTTSLMSSTETITATTYEEMSTYDHTTTEKPTTKLTTPANVMEEITTLESTTEMTTAEKLSTLESTTEITTAEKISTLESTTEMTTAEKISTLESTTEMTTAEKISTLESTIEMTTAEKLSTLESTTEMTTAEKLSTLESTTEMTTVEKLLTSKLTTEMRTAELSTLLPTTKITISDKVSTLLSSTEMNEKISITEVETSIPTTASVRADPVSTVGDITSLATVAAPTTIETKTTSHEVKLSSGMSSREEKMTDVTVDSTISDRKYTTLSSLKMEEKFPTTEATSLPSLKFSTSESSAAVIGGKIDKIGSAGSSHGRAHELENEQEKTELMVVLVVFLVVFILVVIIVALMVTRYKRKRGSHNISHAQSDVRFKDEEDMFIKAYRLSAEASNPSPKPVPRIDVENVDSTEDLVVQLENGNLKKFDSFGSVPWIDASRSTLDKISVDDGHVTLDSRDMTSFSSPEIDTVGTSKTPGNLHPHTAIIENDTEKSTEIDEDVGIKHPETNSYENEQQDIPDANESETETLISMTNDVKDGSVNGGSNSQEFLEFDDNDALKPLRNDEIEDSETDV